MKKTVLFAASEGLPFIKSGGLADVVGSLPQALNAQGLEVRVVLPLYKKIADKYLDTMEPLGAVQITSGLIDREAQYYMAKANGVTYYFVRQDDYFGRDGLYGFPDDGERFSFYQLAVLEMLNLIKWYPNIIHSHDWHVGMMPLLCRVRYGENKKFAKIKHVYTIHNLAFQGNFPANVLTDYLGLDYEYFESGAVRFDGGISFMKTGIIYADKVTTVSPTYANEILTPQFGEHLDEVLRYRRDDLVGIVNGIDTKLWDPATDPCLVQNYDIDTAIEGKLANKLALQKELGLRVSGDVMLVGMVARLTNQKGVYLITEKLRDIMGLDVQIAILGTGEREAEDSFKWMESNYKRRAVYYCGYNDDLAHRIYAGSDLFLMPSIFEPCGIGQLNAMRYGTLPLVRETGGLKDTVIPFNQYTGEGNGFSFWAINADDMFYTLRWAAEQYYLNPLGWKGLIHNAMSKDVSWEKSSAVYMEMYKNLK